ncbi:hypothetical protein MBLNU230_g6463t1 [Neophaeotheca triangularis]
MDLDNDGRDISPYETQIGARLLETLQTAFDTSNSKLTQTPSTGGETLSDRLKALKLINNTIRFNAKWFKTGDISSILYRALELVSNSSSTHELRAALDLIDVVVTYSILPTECIEKCIRYTSQTFYHGTRQHKHKQLAKDAWHVLEHLMQTHLGFLCVEALLRTIGSDAERISSRTGFAETTGAVMVVQEKMLFFKAERRLPRIYLFELLPSLKIAVDAEDEILLEQAMDISVAVAADANKFDELNDEGATELFLELVQRIAILTEDAEALSHLFDNLEARIQEGYVENYLLRLSSEIFIQARRSLPEILSTAAVQPYGLAQLVTQPERMEKLEVFLSQLCKSENHSAEAGRLAQSLVDAIAGYGDLPLVPSSSRYDAGLDCLETCVQCADTTQEAANHCTRGIQQLFYEALPEKMRATAALKTLVKVAADAPCTSARLMAFDTLLSIRADVEGALWIEQSEASLPDNSFSKSTRCVCSLDSGILPTYFDLIMDTLEVGTVWPCYSFVLKQLPAQLRTQSLFSDHYSFVSRLCTVVCEKLKSGTYNEPPPDTGLSKSYVTVQLIAILVSLLSYHRLLGRQQRVDFVATFLNIAGSRDYVVSVHCVHALTICCYELPEIVTGQLDAIVERMAKMVTQRYIAVHVLEFLSGLSNMSELCRNFRPQNFKRILGVCHSYLQYVRDVDLSVPDQQTSSSERSLTSGSDPKEELPMYVYALAHHVIIFWYIAMRPTDRAELRPYITKSLKYTEVDGSETIEDHGMVIMDMMDRIDAEEGVEPEEERDLENFASQDGRITKQIKLAGTMLFTLETSLRTGKTVVTVRRPSGTTKYIVESKSREGEDVADLLQATLEAADEPLPIIDFDEQGRVYGAISTLSPTSVLGSPDIASLPDNDAVERAIAAFDRTPALDSHRAGVIYVGEGQTNEKDILLNAMGSPDYIDFMHGLGKLHTLKGAKFDVGGLDRSDDLLDGKYTIVWESTVTRLNFHITTLMPNNPDHVGFPARKKAHIGNDYVNIVFNNSGRKFDPAVFQTAFGFVYIVVKPSSRTSFMQTRRIQLARTPDERFYEVEVISRAGFPDISSAAEAKIVSGASLADYVRNLALNACVFALVWDERNDGEYPSSWRQRLLQLRKMRERFGAKEEAADTGKGGTGKKKDTSSKKK